MVTFHFLLFLCFQYYVYHYADSQGYLFIYFWFLLTQGFSGQPCLAVQERTLLARLFLHLMILWLCQSNCLFLSLDHFESVFLQA